MAAFFSRRRDHHGLRPLVLAIAYRYYSAFLAAKVPASTTVGDAGPPLQRRPELPPDEQVGAVRPPLRRHLRGRAADRPGAGDPVRLLPGLIWLVIGVCLAGAVQDFIILTSRSAARASRSPRSRFRKLARRRARRRRSAFCSCW